MVKDYIPNTGHIIWLNFDPQEEKEIKKIRPALVMSSRSFNQYGMGFFMPITSKVKFHPYDVFIKDKSKDGYKLEGSILVDQMKSLDWVVRKAKFILECDEQILDDVKLKLTTILDIDY